MLERWAIKIKFGEYEPTDYILYSMKSQHKWKSWLQINSANLLKILGKVSEDEKTLRISCKSSWSVAFNYWFLS